MNEKNIPNKPNANAVGVDVLGDPHSRGITLIALIITIIVMLILVGVSIAMAINGNLFGITRNGAKQTTIEAYREHIEAIRVNAKAEQIKQNLDSAGFLDKVKEGLEEERAKEGNVFEGSTITRPKTSVKIETKEGYLFKITESKILYMGLASEQGELTINLNNENTFFISNPEEGIWTNKKEAPIVTVEIETRVDAEELGAILEYSLDETNWQEYTGKIPVDNNGQKVFARLYSEEDDEEGTHAEYTVKNIDRLEPNPITNFTATCENYKITASGSTTDVAATSTNGSSGIAKYCYSSDNGDTWLPEGGTKDTSYTFEGLEDGKTYSIKMKAVDKAGNECITDKPISVAIPEKPKPKVGDYIDYKPDELSDDYRYTLYGEYSGYGKYSSNVLTTPKDQEIGQEPLNWQILKIYEDGSMDLIGSLSPTKVYFTGALGYNNGVFLLNDICKTLYSKTLSDGRKIEARSVSLKDFEDEDIKPVTDENGKIIEGNWKATRDEYKNSYVQYGGTKTYKGNYSYYPNLYEREIGAGINRETVNETGLKQWDEGYDSPTKDTSIPILPEKPASDNILTVTQAFYKASINKTNYGEAKAKVLGVSYYWVATRLIDATR